MFIIKLVGYYTQPAFVAKANIALNTHCNNAKKARTFETIQDAENFISLFKNVTRTQPKSFEIVPA